MFRHNTVHVGLTRKVVHVPCSSHVMKESYFYSRSGIKYRIIINIFVSQGMGEEEVERLIADLLLAAIDTTSVTALWLLYVLATQQTVQVQAPETQPPLQQSGYSKNRLLSRQYRYRHQRHNLNYS